MNNLIQYNNLLNQSFQLLQNSQITNQPTWILSYYRDLLIGFLFLVVIVQNICIYQFRREKTVFPKEEDISTNQIIDVTDKTEPRKRKKRGR